MKVKMTLKEKQLNEQRARYKHDWQSYILAGDFWLQGYRQALQNFQHGEDSGDEEVEVEFNNGEHQIGAKLGKVN